MRRCQSPLGLAARSGWHGAAGAGDILVVAGGVMPDEDVPALKALGVAEVLLQETPPETVAARIRELVAARPSR